VLPALPAAGPRGGGPREPLLGRLARRADGRLDVAERALDPYAVLLGREAGLADLRLLAFAQVVAPREADERALDRLRLDDAGRRVVDPAAALERRQPAPRERARGGLETLPV